MSRIFCRSQRYEADLILDINSELCQLNAKDNFKMVLASSLSLDNEGKSDNLDLIRWNCTSCLRIWWWLINTDEYRRHLFCYHVIYVTQTSGTGARGYDQSGKKSLADDYEYVMFGKIFKFVEDTTGALRVAVHASYGGLLMQLTVCVTLWIILNVAWRFYLFYFFAVRGQSM